MPTVLNGAMARIVVMVLCATITANVLAADDPPPFYRKQATWQETMRLSREALMALGDEAEKAAVGYEQENQAARSLKEFSATLEAGADMVWVSLDVSGLSSLCIRSAELPVEKKGRGGWLCFGSPRLVPVEGEPVPITGDRRLVAALYGNHQYRTETNGDWKKAGLTESPPEAGKRTGDADDRTDVKVGEPGGDKPASGRFSDGFMIKADAEVLLRTEARFKRFEAWIRLVPDENRPGEKLVVSADWRSREELRRQEDDAKNRLWELVREDFRSTYASREQETERRDRIWDSRWTAGDLKAIATRYASRCSRALSKPARERAATARTVEDLALVRDAYYFRHASEWMPFVRKTLELVERTAPRPRMTEEFRALETLINREDIELSPELSNVFSRVVGLRRRAIMSHPALDFDRLLINKRQLSRYNHMCDQYLGRHSGVGPGLVILDDWKTEPKETVLLEGKLPPGSVLHPDLSYDGERILFSYCDHSEGRTDYRRFWIYEIGVDGQGLRQLTGTPDDPREGWEGRETVLIEDWDPCYLPDGGFAFVSTRSQSFGRCHGSRYVPTYMLFRANSDGSGIRQLSFGEANEWDPAVLPDGRIIYCRWDYINRHDTVFQSLWTTRQDGTNTAHYYGNYSRAPCMITEAQPIPDDHRVVATATDHHGHTGGTLIVIDPRVGQDGGEPLISVTPELGFPESGTPANMTLTERPRYPVGRHACTPWPLTADLFLAAYQEQTHYAIYLIDTLGGRELILRDAHASCTAPIPVRPRAMPSKLASPLSAALDTPTGTFYLRDVHRGTGGLAPGTIKRLRINRIYGQPTRSKPSLSLANNEIIKGIVGTVPIHEDGSVAFRAPAGVPLQLQALDASGMAVMTMRSLVYLQPGEQVSCVGCHEPRTDTPPQQTVPRPRTVRTLDPPAGPRYAGGFSFVRTVQPVLDRYCIECHGLSKTEGKLSLLGTPTTYSQSHDALTGRPNLVVVAYRNRETGSSKPKDYFAHAGKLIQIIRDQHRGRVKLDPESMQRIIDWLDLNAQFYGDYSHNRVEKRRTDGDGEKRLRQAIAGAFGEELAQQPFEALVNAALPSESRILNAPLSSPAGGWGQIAADGWASREDPGYERMAGLVADCLRDTERHDVAGTCGDSDHCRCGCCWVRLHRVEYRTAAR